MEKPANEKQIFGKILKELRLKAGKTQEQLAFDMGVERIYISMLERGVNGPTLTSMLSASKALGIKLSELAELFENRFSNN